jgi:hypothetical protein
MVNVNEDIASSRFETSDSLQHDVVITEPVTAVKSQPIDYDHNIVDMNNLRAKLQMRRIIQRWLRTLLIVL